MNISFKTYSFINKKVGQRSTPFTYFYLTPLISYSKTAIQESNIHIGWLFWTILITYKKY